MVRALVVWSTPDQANLGVQALADGTVALARRAWPGVEIDHLGYGYSHGPMRVGNPRSLARELVTRRNGLGDWFAGFDVVLDTRAGDSFADIYGLTRHTTMTLVGEIAQRSGTPMVLTPQTIGPFGTRRGRLLARRTLGTASAVLARDHVSHEHARSLTKRPVTLTTDVVFALDVPPRTERFDVLLNVSGLLWEENPHVDAAAYRDVVRRLHAALVAQGREVALLAHVLDSAVADNDVPTVRAVGEELGAEVVVPTSLDDVRALVASARLVIGSRMHACLNALSTGTPAVALAYSRKFAPLLADLGWDAVVDLRSDADPVASALAHVSDDALAGRAATTRDRAQGLLGDAVAALRAVVPPA